MQILKLSFKFLYMDKPFESDVLWIIYILLYYGTQILLNMNSINPESSLPFGESYLRTQQLVYMLSLSSVLTWFRSRLSCSLLIVIFFKVSDELTLLVYLTVENHSVFSYRSGIKI